jgi:hypothetical protein
MEDCQRDLRPAQKKQWWDWALLLVVMPIALIAIARLFVQYADLWIFSKIFNGLESKNKVTYAITLSALWVFSILFFGLLVWCWIYGPIFSL